MAVIGLYVDAVLLDLRITGRSAPTEAISYVADVGTEFAAPGMLEAPARSYWVRFGKPVFDRVMAATALAVLSPIIVAAALAVKLTSDGPAFYRQHRVGMHGEIFTLYRLRTMYADSDTRRAALLRDSEQSGLLFAMRQDPRVTPVGRVLRRYSVDELPELLSVLRGSMSLIGPRPALPAEVDAYPNLVRRRLLVKPDMTGLWQVSGSSTLSWDEAVRLDLKYVEGASFGLDIYILWRTARAVLGGEAPY